MDSVEVAVSVLQQIAFEEGKIKAGEVKFVQAAACIRRYFRSERLRDEVRSRVSDLVPALFQLSDRQEAHSLMIDLVTYYVSKPEIRIIPLILSCLNQTEEFKATKGLLYLGVAFDSLSDPSRPRAAEKIHPTLLTLSKTNNPRLQHKSNEILRLIEPYLQPKPQENSPDLPFEQALAQWLNGGPALLTQKLLGKLQEIANFRLLLTYLFDQTASEPAKLANFPDKAVSVLTDVANTSKLLKISSLVVSEEICTCHTDLHIERLFQVHPSLEDLNRACSLLTHWLSKDSKRLIPLLASGSFLPLALTHYIHFPSMQNFCLFVCIFNRLLTHETIKIMQRELTPVVLGNLSNVLGIVPQSKAEIGYLAGSLTVFTHIIHTISSNSTSLIAIDEVKLDPELDKPLSNERFLRTEVFVTYGKAFLSGILAIYTRDYWTIECETEAAHLRNASGSLLNFILSKVNSDFASFQDVILGTLSEFSVKLERILQVQMRIPSETRGFDLPGYRVERPMNGGLVEVIVTFSRLLTSSQWTHYTAESWSTLFQLVFIHPTNGILLSSILRLTPSLFLLPEPLLRTVLLTRGVMHKFIQAANSDDLLRRTPDFQAVIRILMSEMQTLVQGNGALAADIRKHSLWKQYLNKQTVIIAPAKRTISLTSRNSGKAKRKPS